MESMNFEFLREHNPLLADMGGYAEAIIHIDPGSALTRLRSFAEILTKSIYKEERLSVVPQMSFYEMLKADAFEHVVDKRLSHQINYLRIQGNDTAHGAEGDKRTAMTSLGIAWQLGVYLAVRYYGIRQNQIPEFQDLKPAEDSASLNKELEQVQKELEEKNAQLTKLIAEQEERTKSPAEESQSQQQSKATADSLQWDEAKTRKLLIDAMLSRAGWDVNNPEQVVLEMEVKHQPTKTGLGYADYVLLGADGKPLAVIEAKRAINEDIRSASEQARIYADGLEKEFGQRPVIFATNGYETIIWDDLQYNSARTVYGFYSEDSLNYLIYQRTYREADVEKNNPNTEIAGRTYQIEAIKSVANRFAEQRRKALIIQATGTGKTRVSIALVELMIRTGWAKRILFLCDRVELRRQADEAFKEHLPSEPRCVIGDTNQVDQSARIYVATYPSMMNRFAQLDVGFFDLIIADESHRSIYNKYRDLFYYFDSLQLGLTATPVKFISRNTFDLFGCPDQDPTFEFSLDDAINNQPPFLVPFKVIDHTTEFLREGITYDQLSEEQKRQLEQDLGEEKAQQTTIQGKDVGRRIYSKDTDREILRNLMENGIKDAEGMLVGKTIVFAQNQKHAEQLASLFDELYPQYGQKVCKLIHNKVKRASALIDEFKKAGNEFRIAISVDMLDTGIDVPEVVNLVFAKPVRSWVKFWQMIGRGTRLCENLYGPGKDKSEFLIFDHYGNFTFFEEEYQEGEQQNSKSILQQLFEARLEMAKVSLQNNHASGFDLSLKLIAQDINDLPQDSIAVIKELRIIHQLQQVPDLLGKLEPSTQQILAETIAPLMANRVLKDKDAISLDRLMAELSTCFIQQASCLEACKTDLLQRLDTLAVNIQAVRQQDALIAEVRSQAFWESLSIEQIEKARSSLRDIMRFRQVDPQPKGANVTEVREDSDAVYHVERKVVLGGETEAIHYRNRLKTILDEMLDSNPVLQKLYRGEAIAANELDTLTSTILTSHPGVDLSVLNEFYGRPAEELPKTIQQLIGLDVQFVEQHFTEFLHSHPQLTAQQVRFMNLLKKYISENGTIQVEKLYDRPFTTVSSDGIDGVFQPADVDQLITVLKPFLPTAAH